MERTSRDISNVTQNIEDLPIAVLISGGGTTLKNLLDKREAGQCPVDIRLVISGKASAGGLQHAQQANIPTEVVHKKSFSSPEAHREAVFEHCRKSEVQYVVMGGYLDHLLIAPDFENRVINIHPSLIPAFCGKGFYGLRVHQAAINYGVKISGCTVHFVDDEFDHGPIIAQRTCEVKQNDTPDSLQRRVFEQECILLPEVLRGLAANAPEICDRVVTLR